MRIRPSMIAISSIVVALFATPAAAWDGITTGKISGVDVVTVGQNFGYRIYMDGQAMCGTSEAWAYINRNEDNYDAMVSLLTSSYLSGKPVSVYTTKNGP